MCLKVGYSNFHTYSIYAFQEICKGVVKNFLNKILILWRCSMNRKVICSIIRIVEMTVALTIMRQTYQIGALGYLMVALTGIVWNITAVIEHIE